MDNSVIDGHNSTVLLLNAWPIFVANRSLTLFVDTLSIHTRDLLCDAINLCRMMVKAATPSNAESRNVQQVEERVREGMVEEMININRVGSRSSSRQVFDTTRKKKKTKAEADEWSLLPQCKYI